MMPVPLYLDCISVVAPGIDGWGDFVTRLKTRAVLVGEDGWRPVPQSISPRSRRRLSPQTLLAISVAEQLQPCLSDTAAWVFASSVGEGETLKVILDALATPRKAIQPLKFQNSVHNAASGQWTIAAQINCPATSLSAHDFTVGVGFLKASMQVKMENRPVGLVFYDAPLPYPLSVSHQINIPFGVGFALAPSPGQNTIAELDISFSDVAPARPSGRSPVLPNDAHNPVLDCLPLLQNLVEIQQGTVFLPLSKDGDLQIDVRAL